jgi:uncharacterized protein YndB with AHSA1/START domain
MNKVVEIERRIRHPVERVYAAWLRPEMFPRWFLPDPKVTLGAVRVDARVGGSFLIEMIVEGQSLEHTGKYRKMVPNQELEFTWHSPMTGGTDSLVQVTFLASGVDTIIRLRHEFLPDADSRGAHASGWANILESLDAFLTAEVTP